MLKFTLCLWGSLISVLAFAQQMDRPPDPQPGKCYAKYVLSDQYTYVVVGRFPVFSGLSMAGIELDTVYFGKKSEQTWVRSSIDPNRSFAVNGHPSVWTLVEATPYIDTLIVVKDTTQTDQFSWKIYGERKLSVKGGLSEWNEVLCQEKITNGFVKQLAEKLTEAGYPVDVNIASFELVLRSKLTQYQKDHGLPVGGLNMKTLEKLKLGF